MLQKLMNAMVFSLLYTILLITPATLASRTKSTETDLETKLEATFDELVELNDITLTPEEKEYRLSIFTVNCLAQSSGIGKKIKKIRKRRQDKLCPGISIDSIYTQEELNGMNGAVMEDSTPPEVLSSEEDNTRLRRQAEEVPASYDVREEIQVSKPTHQKTCGNCYIHTFVSALEIAYTKQTGKFVPFSRQELTDCFYSGCDGGDYRVVANMMSVLDHLSTPSQYGPYLSQYTKKKFACKAGLTPDSLLDVKVRGYKRVTDGTLDYNVYKHGSVMACVDWIGSDTNNCGSIKDVGEEVFDGDTVPLGCTHAVLIVGYTSEYYIVKNSHGVSWGDQGYFKIKRGKNACGIEDNMAVLITERRENPKELAPNNCPLDRPTYCPESQSCTSSGTCLGVNMYRNLIRNKLAKRAAPAMRLYNSKSYKGRVSTGGIHDVIRKKIEDRRKLVEAQRNRGGSYSSGSRGYSRRISQNSGSVRYRESSSARDIQSFQFLSHNQRCEDQAGEARCAMLKSKGYCSTHLVTKEVECRKTCGLCWDREQTEQCRDISESCSQLSLPLCDILYRVRRNCPARCNTCHLVNPEKFESAVNWMPRQPAGPCNIPQIPNGRVIVPGNRRFLQSGETLQVQCDTGFTLTGEEVQCVIQDVFSPDTRVLPECVKIEERELQGNGADYRGSKNVSASGRPCLSWNREIYRGSVFLTRARLSEIENGNHHYCRNTGGGRAVPYCLVDTEDNSITSRGGGEEEHFRHPDSAMEPRTEIQFCFSSPGCDKCSAEVEDYLGTEYCAQLAAEGKCEYMNANSEQQQTHVWEKCTKSCCSVSSCSATHT